MTVVYGVCSGSIGEKAQQPASYQQRDDIMTAAYMTASNGCWQPKWQNGEKRSNIESVTAAWQRVTKITSA